MTERVALVTGAAGGIGLAICRALLAQGGAVIGVDLDEERLFQSRGHLLDSGFSGFMAHRADLTDAAEVAQLFASVEQQHQGLDVLVNNAGTCICTEFVEISPDELRRQMAINFDSAFYCCQHAIPLMLKRPGIKKIINISSNGAYNFEVFDPAHYRASKAALDTLTKHLTRRYARGDRR
jgi:NAD(P)-dependent dehydrogenase (short-subunit alcohol dehydrogenase family)